MSDDDERSSYKKSPGADSDSERPLGPPTKRRAHRVSRACDFCHHRSIRCRQDNPIEVTSGANPGRCHSCIEYGKECTYNRPFRKRGVKSAASRTTSSSLPSPSLTTDLHQSIAQAFESPTAFKAPNVLKHEDILTLVEIYYETIYPSYPFFHRQTLARRLQAREYLANPQLYAAIIALAALTTGRIRDAALFTEKWNEYDFTKLPESETLASLANSFIPRDSRGIENFDCVRAVALMVPTSLQNGVVKEMHMWMGFYHMIVRATGGKDEKNWPDTIGLVEQEERRRLFWSMYTVEIFSAACFDTWVACREAQNKVLYPREMDDEHLDAVASAEWTGQPLPEDTTAASVWLHGWNFATDMYRVLEHAIDRQREFENAPHSKTARKLFSTSRQPFDPNTVYREVMHDFSTLPKAFLEIRPITFDRRSDIFGFQAANISATVQLVRLALVGPEIATVDQSCHIVQEVIQTFAELPIGYLKALSIPLLHHLSGIGSFLSKRLEHPVTDGEWNLMRTTLVGLADLIRNLGIGTQVGEEPSKRVRVQVLRMDEYMRVQFEGAQRHGHNPALLANYSMPDHAFRSPASGSSQDTSNFSSVAPTPASGSFAGSVLSGMSQPNQYQSGLNRFTPKTYGPAFTTGKASSSSQGQARQSFSQYAPEYTMSSELMEDMSWALDFAQPTDMD